jgi:hypothetical protein
MEVQRAVNVINRHDNGQLAPVSIAKYTLIPPGRTA